MPITEPTIGQTNWGTTLNTALTQLDTIGASNGYHTQGPTSGAITIDASTGQYQNVVLNGNVTSWNVTNGAVGQRVTVQFTQDATGSRTLAGANAAIKLTGGAWVLTTTASKSDSVTLMWDGTNWREVARAANI